MNIKDVRVGMPVRRIKREHPYMNVGAIGVVTYIPDSGDIVIDGLDKFHSPRYLEPAYSLEVGCKVMLDCDHSQKGILKYQKNLSTGFYGVLWDDISNPISAYSANDLIVIKPAPETNDKQFFYNVQCQHYDEPCHLNENGGVSCYDCLEAGKHLYKGCECYLLRGKTNLSTILKPGIHNGVMFTKEAIDKCKADIDTGEHEYIINNHICQLFDIDKKLFDKYSARSLVAGIAAQQWRRTIGGNKMDEKTLDEVCKQLKITIVGMEGSSHILSDGRVGEFSQKEISVPITAKDDQTFIKRLPDSMKNRAFIGKAGEHTRVFVTYEFIEARSSKERREADKPPKAKK